MSGHPFHTGELSAQMRFNESWDEEKAKRLGGIVGRTLDDDMTAFIEGLPFFFLATSDANGHCDCSFKGSEPAEDGHAVRVTGSQRLVFPDYAGNRMFNSLGNLLVNPQAGMLFIDFAARRRLRVNGAARILEAGGEWRTYWPNAPRAVEVQVAQVYWNCSRRIPATPCVNRAR